MTDFPTLDGTAVRRLLLEVAETLHERGLSSTIVIAGGSLLAWLDLRGVDARRGLGSTIASC